MTTENIDEAMRLRDVALGLAASGLANYPQPGTDPTIIRDELFGIIIDAITNAPRSQQTTIGPSEIGTDCDRKLAFKLGNTPAARELAPAWRATVGTAVHTWLADMLAKNNETTGIPRWLIEATVGVGDIDDEDVYGSCDAYDALSAIVIDWKIVGPTSLTKYRRHGPSPQYRTQLHLYGRGWANLGLPISYVANFFLPSNGELADGVFWYEPYDEAIATEALDRATKIRRVVKTGGAAIVPLLNTADAPCAYCPWFSPPKAAQYPGVACAGHPKRATRNDSLYRLAGKKAV